MLLCDVHCDLLRRCVDCGSQGRQIVRPLLHGIAPAWRWGRKMVAPALLRGEAAWRDVFSALDQCLTVWIELPHPRRVERRTVDEETGAIGRHRHAVDGVEALEDGQLGAGCQLPHARRLVFGSGDEAD